MGIAEEMSSSDDEDPLPSFDPAWAQKGDSPKVPPKTNDSDAAAGVDLEALNLREEPSGWSTPKRGKQGGKKWSEKGGGGYSKNHRGGGGGEGAAGGYHSRPHNAQVSHAADDLLPPFEGEGAVPHATVWASTAEDYKIEEALRLPFKNLRCSHEPRVQQNVEIDHEKGSCSPPSFAAFADIPLQRRKQRAAWHS